MSNPSSGSGANKPLPARLILFDGVCNLCAFWVGFVIRRDSGKRFRFAPLQSETARRLLEGWGLSADSPATMVYLEEGRVYLRSAAALRVLKGLGAGWPLCYGLIAVPAPLRDAFYRFLARHRCRWFGRREACPAPAPEIQDRFLD